MKKFLFEAMTEDEKWKMRAPGLDMVDADRIVDEIVERIDEEGRQAIKEEMERKLHGLEAESRERDSREAESNSENEDV